MAIRAPQQFQVQQSPILNAMLAQEQRQQQDQGMFGGMQGMLAMQGLGKLAEALGGGTEMLPGSRGIGMNTEMVDPGQQTFDLL